MPDYTPAALYALAKQMHPDGLICDNFIPVSIDGRAMELRYATDRGHGDDVQFMLFVPKHEYARRSIIVYANGSVVADDEGIIPSWDLVPDEQPNTTAMDTILREIFATLQAQAPL